MLKKPAIWAEIGEIDGFIAIFIRLHDHSGLWCGRADHTTTVILSVVLSHNHNHNHSIYFVWGMSKHSHVGTHIKAI